MKKQGDMKGMKKGASEHGEWKAQEGGTDKTLRRENEDENKANRKTLNDFQLLPIKCMKSTMRDYDTCFLCPYNQAILQPYYY